MARSRTFAAVAALALLALAVPGVGRSAEPLRVGVGVADLTWHVGQNRLGDVTARIPDVAGQDVPDDPFVFAGLHSRPQAKAIVVAGAEPFAFVRADILMVTGDLYEAVAQRVLDATGIPPERLLVAATHTHVANNGLFPHPVHSAVYRSFDPREQVYLADRIALAVASAMNNLRPATLAVGSGSVTLPTENRRYTNRESLNQPPFANDPSRIDAELGVLRFDDASTGRPMAVLMNYGVHPVVLINNPLVSADFIAFAESGAERALADPDSGESPTAIWFTGAQGDQDPVYVRYSYPEAEWTDRLFADETVRVAKTLHPEPITGAALVEKVIPLPGPDGPLLPSSEIVGPRLPLPGPASVLIPSSVRIQAIELSTAASRTVLMTWPGEPIRDIGVALKDGAKAAGFDHAFVLALANDWAGYWLTPAEYDRRLYERTLMFYGQTSALYVEEHVLNLVNALATGAAVTQVPLPPKAVVDRELTRMLAAAAYAADPVLREAVLAVPEPASPAALIEPADVARPGAVTFSWVGGSPDQAHNWIPRVTAERLEGILWVPVAHEGTGELLLAARSPLPGQAEWTARWEALPDTPAGTYRFRVEGQRATLGGQEGFSISSDEFEVTACACIAAGTMLATPSSGGRTLLRVPATYGNVVALPVPHTDGGFRLQPLRVTTGAATIEVLQGTTVIGTVTLGFVSDVQPVPRTITVHDVSGFDLPVTIVEPTELGMFEGVWSGASAVTFRLAGLVDGAGNTL